MTYAFIQDVPADREMYAKIRAKLPTAAPAGLITHVVIEQESGLRYVDVWESKDKADRFMERVMGMVRPEELPRPDTAAEKPIREARYELHDFVKN